MTDALVKLIPHETRKVAVLSDKAAKETGLPAAPSGDRRARVDDDGSWNAAVSEGWPSSPPASPPPSHHVDRA